MTGSVLLVGGGARSGKSAFAIARARSLGDRRVFVATAEALDDEMRDRIATHRGDRGADFETVEAPRNLPEAIERVGIADVVVVDCVTLWLSNLLVAGTSPDAILGEVDRLVAALGARRFHSIVVTNEVGMGVVPETALGRAFRDVVGRAHQSLAATADEIHLAVLGTVLTVFPGPLEVARGPRWTD